MIKYSPLAPFAVHAPPMWFAASVALDSNAAYSLSSFQAFSESANACLAPTEAQLQLAISLSAVPEPATDQKIVACSAGSFSPTLATAAVHLNAVVVTSSPSLVAF